MGFVFAWFLPELALILLHRLHVLLQDALITSELGVERVHGRHGPAEEFSNGIGRGRGSFCDQRAGERAVRSEPWV